MVDVPLAWLQSGGYAEIGGHRLRPVENPFLPGTPLVVVRGQAQAFYLRDDNNLDFVLKKFLPAKTPTSAYLNAIQSLIPHRPGFQSGYLRRVLEGGDLSKSGFCIEELERWIEKTVLMPTIKGSDWAFLAERMRSGLLTTPNDERLLFCRSLSSQVALLEDHDISHRDLSGTNVFLDVQAQLVLLIDWDTTFHQSLSMPPNTTFGTCGYIAPFVKKLGVPDPRTTWRTRADRFSLSILNCELLALNAGSPITGDGGMFDQEELYERTGDGINVILDTLRRNFPGADTLLKRALDARGFDDCPSPAEWIAFSSGVALPLVEAGEDMPPVAFYSCFISYNNKDQEFAQRLYSRLRDAGLRVWFAPENVRSGVKLLEQVDRAIQMHDRLLLVLSETSLHSNWVQQEIRRARKFERESGRRKLFPIRLTDYETLQEWVCIDTATVEDLAEEVRSYFIPDFSNWKSYDDFEKAFGRLLDDLRPTT